MNFNLDGEQLLRTFEGCNLTSYQDSGGIWTVGYGHTGPDVTQGMTITQAQAEQLFQNDILLVSGKVNSIVNSCLNSNQYSAAVCFAYNVRSWQGTPLFGLLASGMVALATQHWLLYDKITVNGQKIEVQGLKNRRQAELNLFCKLENS